ncbi:hypothetical protein CASFOL_029692 [Castilleja foliolosa]|uniref:F-box domain-containing protein n=1 Tax=Castilleja foliolosa TaxID=1961234 RepID=A0ABD3C8I5_9LAMI
MILAVDVCSLGSCSRFWRDLCGSDCVWEALYKDRWPGLSVDENQEFDPNSKRWKDLYISKHNEMVEKTALITSSFESSLAYESTEFVCYLKAIELLYSLQFGFKDVQMFLLKPNLSVLLNSVGLHYCIICLRVSTDCVIEALNNCRVSERQVCIQYWKVGRWFYCFHLRDGFISRNVSLGDLTTVLGFANRGAIHEVTRVQISGNKPTQTLWAHQVAQV